MNFGDRLRSEHSLNLFNNLFDQILNESQRGAVLIATSVVQDHLKKEVVAILPEEQTKKKEKDLKRLLFSFPGPLSSFSGLISLSYTFGYIDRKLYDSLNLLRAIRNDAAHIESDFKLGSEKYENRFNEIFKLFDNAPYFIHNLSVKALAEHKIAIIKNFIEQEIEDEGERREYYKTVFEDSDRLSILETQKFHWVLIYGSLFLCAYISDRFSSRST